MTVGKNEIKDHITGFKEEIQKVRKNSPKDFFGWFNTAKDKQEAFIRGSWDFAVHIALPISRHINSPENLTLLEIGHGGGRILAAASRFCKIAIGVDIHNENDFVMKHLNMAGIDNIELHKTNGKSIPLKKNSVDVVYSFIVLQHVEKIEIFKNYVNESYRVLKNGGVAVLYFGREYKYSINKSSLLLYHIDRLYENFTLRNGYREIPAKVNETNLKVSLSFAKKIVKQAGFSVLKTLVSRKKVPNGINLFGGQNGLILKK